MLDQAEALRRLVNKNNNSLNEEIEAEKKEEEQKEAKIITVTSGKGGVGKSNFIVNLAISLTKEGKKVLIFDADIGMGNDDILMGIHHKYNIMDVINGEIYLEDGIIEGPLGIHLLPGGSGINNVEDLSQQQREGFIEKIDSIAGYDYILIDTGAGINRTVLAFISSSDEVIVVLTPDPTSLTDGYSLLKSLKHFKINTHTNIVINRVIDTAEADSTYSKFNLAARRFLNIDTDYLGFIYEDRNLTMAVRSQTPVTIKYPNSDAAKSINNVAMKLVGKEDAIIGNGAKGLFKKLFDIFS